MTVVDRRFFAFLILCFFLVSGLAQAQADIQQPVDARVGAVAAKAAAMPVLFDESTTLGPIDSALQSKNVNVSTVINNEAALKKSAPSISPNSTKKVDETSQVIRVIVGLSVLAILPGILVSVSAFLRIIIVLSMLRHAIGMPETPPNSALIGIALFLTLFTMMPTLKSVDTDAFQPYMEGKIGVKVAYERASLPLRDFMVRQTREQDLALMVELSKSKPPETMDDIGNLQLIPAFMLSELRSAFQIGFVIFLPFLLIDLIVSSILMALGMMMMPPISIALPLKILMFILVDGWSLVLKALIGSFH